MSSTPSHPSPVAERTREHGVRGVGVDRGRRRRDPGGGAGADARGARRGRAHARRAPGCHRRGRLTPRARLLGVRAAMTTPAPASAGDRAPRRGADRAQHGVRARPGSGGMKIAMTASTPGSAATASIARRKSAAVAAASMSTGCRRRRPRGAARRSASRVASPAARSAGPRRRTRRRRRSPGRRRW